jgi:thiamine biosynthesis lipoprotein
MNTGLRQRILPWLFSVTEGLRPHVSFFALTRCARLTRGAVVLSMLAAAVCWGRSDPAGTTLRLAKSADAMGTTFSIILYGDDMEKMEAAVDSVFAELLRLDQMLSNYNPESEWSTINRDAAARPVAVSPELFQLLSECLRYSRESDGAFDISVGPLIKVWGFYRGSGALPAPGDVAQVLRQVGYSHLRLDPTAGTVQFERSGVEIDPGGIGKGYAVDRMVGILRRMGFTTALVAASNSSLYGMGSPPTETQGWKVGISHPRHRRKTVAELFLKDMSMSTSGSYEKFFRAGGRIYSHVIDPQTGYPAQGTSQVTVVAPRAIDSDAWTKPYFIKGRAWAEEHKLKGSRVMLCADGPEPACGWVQ